MPAKGNTFSNDLLKLIFNGTAIANIADNAAAGPLNNLFVSLHTGNPGFGGSQTTSEAAYGSYTRVTVTRASAGFTVTGTVVSPTTNISFPSATSGSETETYFAIGTATSGAGKILYTGTISPSISVSNGVQPILTTASTLSET